MIVFFYTPNNVTGEGEAEEPITQQSLNNEEKQALAQKSVYRNKQGAESHRYYLREEEAQCLTFRSVSGVYAGFIVPQFTDAPSQTPRGL